MKRRELIRRMTGLGAQFIREGSDHSIYWNPRTRVLIPVPRHREINEHLAGQILRKAEA